MATANWDTVAVRKDTAFRNERVDDCATAAATPLALHPFSTAREGAVRTVLTVVLGFRVDASVTAHAFDHWRQATGRAFHPPFGAGSLPPVIDAGEAAGSRADVAGPFGCLLVIGRGAPQVTHGVHGSLGAGAHQGVALAEAVGITGTVEALVAVLPCRRKVAGPLTVVLIDADPDLTASLHCGVPATTVDTGEA